MGRRPFLLMLLLFVPSPARATQLHWSGGATDLTVSQNTQAVLVFQADSAEVTLPNSWRLQWAADSLGLQFSPFEQACLVDTAKVDSIAPPPTPADSAASIITAYFCSSGSSNAATAYFLADLPAGGHGKMKVVALDPGDPDSASVIESNEVTFNGGIDGEYAPVVLHTTSDHSTTLLRVEVVGASLSGVLAMSVSAPELHTDIALTLLSSNDSLVVATADIALPLPTSDVLVSTAQGTMSSGMIPADEVAALASPDEAFYRDPAYPTAYPKDFAFVNTPTPISGVWQNLFHIYYIRSWHDGRPDSTNEVTFGHAWSRDLVHWLSNASAFSTDSSPPAWDHKHVWAPSIIRNGTSYAMFYTGVNFNFDQTIGYATTSVIDTIDAAGHWVRQAAPVHTPANATGWVSQAHPWDFRDPFVMADPANPNTRLLMFYTAKQVSDPAHLAIGVARSASGSLSSWQDLGYYPATDFAHTQAARVESPHAFPDSIHYHSSQQLQATWRLMFTDGAWTDSSRAILFDSKIVGSPVTDLAASSWSATPTPLYDYLHLTPSSPEYAHQASEILQIGGTYYWAGFDGADIRFRKVIWGGTTQFWLSNIDFLAVEDRRSPRPLSLTLAGFQPGQGTARFRIDVPARMRANLVLYDVLGRRIRPLVDRELMPGSTEVAWDGRDRDGAAVMSGIYFARLVATGGSRVIRVPLVR